MRQRREHARPYPQGHLLSSTALKAKMSHTQAEKSVMRMTNSSHKCISPMTRSTSRATGYADGEFPRLPPGLWPKGQRLLAPYLWGKGQEGIWEDSVFWILAFYGGHSQGPPQSESQRSALFRGRQGAQPSQRPPETPINCLHPPKKDREGMSKEENNWFWDDFNFFKIIYTDIML